MSAQFELLAALENEAARCRLPLARRPERKESSDDALRQLTRQVETQRAALLPVASDVVANLQDMVVAGGCTDAATWTAAVTCAAVWPSASCAFAAAVMESAVTGQSGCSLLESAALAYWTDVVTLVGSRVDSALCTRYAAVSSERLSSASECATVDQLRHLTTLVLCVQPMSRVVVRHCCNVADAAQQSRCTTCICAAAALRSALGAVVHPRCAPLHLRVASTTYEPAAPILSVNATGNVLPMPASREAFAPPALGRAAASQAENANARQRHQPAAKVTPAADDDDYDAGDIVDE